VIEAIDVAPHVKAPELAFAGFVTQRLKRNCDLQRPAVTGQLALGFHNDIDAEIRAAAFGKNAVLLHTKRVKAQHVGLTLIIKGIEKQPDVVFPKHIVPLGHSRPALAGIVVGLKAEIKKLRVIADEDFGWFRWSNIVAGISLVEVPQDHRRLPDFIIKLAVDDRRFLEARNPYRLGFLGRNHYAAGRTFA